MVPAANSIGGGSFSAADTGSRRPRHSVSILSFKLLHLAMTCAIALATAGQWSNHLAGLCRQTSQCQYRSLMIHHSVQHSNGPPPVSESRTCNHCTVPVVTVISRPLTSERLNPSRMNSTPRLLQGGGGSAVDGPGGAGPTRGGAGGRGDRRTLMRMCGKRRWGLCSRWPRRYRPSTRRR